MPFLSIAHFIFFHFCPHGHFNAKYLEKCLGITGIPLVKRFTTFLLVFSKQFNKSNHENLRYLRLQIVNTDGKKNLTL